MNSNSSVQQYPNTDSSSWNQKIKKEVYFLVALFIVFLILSTALSAQLWPVWMDEVLLVDPGVNLWMGNGFTSSAWYYQTYHDFWACNSPLYSFLISLWLSIFGFSVTATRFLNYGLIVAILGILWLAVYRLNLIQSMRDRIIGLSILLLSTGISFNYLSGRYDCLGILLFAGLILTYSLPSSLLQSVAFIGLGGLIPFTGFHLIPYAVIMSLLLLIYLRKIVVKAIAFTAVGVALGIIGLLLLYLSQGVLDIFIQSVGGHSLAGVDLSEGVGDASLIGKIGYVLTNFFPILLSRMENIIQWYLRDKTFVFLYASALTLMAIQGIEKRFHWRSPLGFAIVSGLVIPLCMGLARDYPDYYTWMAILPVTLGVSATLYEWRDRSLSAQPAIWAVIALLGAGILVGFPNHLVHAVLHWQDRDYQQVETFVLQNIDPSEAVYSDFGPYYAIRKQVSFVLFPTYLDVISDIDKDKLSTLLIDTSQIHHNYQDINLFEIIGGEWEEASPKLDTSQFNLRIFRRSK